MGWLSLLTVGLTLVSAMYTQFFGDAAILNRWKLALADKQARQQVEAERLKATYERIAHEPELSGQALAEKLNETMRKLKHQP